MGEPQTDRLIAVLGAGVICCPQSGPSAGVTLCGVSAGDPHERLILSFIAGTGADLPATLDGATVVALGEGRYRIDSPPRQWFIRAHALHLHRDARPVFFQAIPPRPAPLGKRLFWRVVLWAAGHRTGLRLLKALRGR